MSNFRSLCVKESSVAGVPKAVRLQRGRGQQQKPQPYSYKWPNTSHKAAQKTAQVSCFSSVLHKYSGTAALVPLTANEVCKTDPSWPLLLEVLLIVVDWSCCPPWRNGHSGWMQHTDPSNMNYTVKFRFMTWLKDVPLLLKASELSIELHTVPAENQISSNRK